MKKSTFLNLLFLLLPLFGFSQNEYDTPSEVDSSLWEIDIEDIVVTAQYAPTDRKNALQNIRVITKETIAAQGATNLEQLLQQDANIRIQQDLILGSSLRLLGVGGENIKIMIDGVPVIGRLNGNIDLSQINLNNIERVEIVEGPMSVAYGTDALGGVINLITKKSMIQPHLLTINRQLETRGEQVTNVNMGIGVSENILVQVTAGRDEFDGFDTDTLRSSIWNPKKQWYTEGSVRWNFAQDHYIRYAFSYFDEEVTNLGILRRPIFQPYAFDDVYLTKRFDHRLSHEGTIAKNFYLQNTLAYNDYNRESNTSRIDFDTDKISPLSSDTTAFDAWMMRSVFASKFANFPLNFQVGVDLRYEKGQGERILDVESDQPGRSSIGDYAVFGQLRYQVFPALTLEGGLRVAKNARYDAPLIPAFNLKYQVVKPLTFRASYARGFRSPSLKELFLNFIDINHFIIGNPNLQAETSDNFQANLEFQQKMRAHDFQINANFFYNNINDRIQLFPFLEEDGKLIPVSPEQSAEYAYFNMANSKIRGVNLGLKYQWKFLGFESNLSRVYTFNPISEEFPEVEAYTPATEYSLKGSISIPPSKTQFSIFYRGNDQFISFYPTIVDGEEQSRQRTVPGFTVVDCTIGQSFWNKRIQLTTGIRNLLDTQQVNVIGGGGGTHSSGNSRAISPGRSYFINISLQLGE
ncbi:MAG: TonB-dependent receptor [Bacteroidota bacterium]